MDVRGEKAREEEAVTEETEEGINPSWRERKKWR